MELKEFSDSLRRRTNDEIEIIDLRRPDALSRTSQVIVIVDKCIYELKRFVVDYNFKGLEEEIEFFKVIKPEYAGLLTYHKKLFRIQLFEAYNSPDARLKYFRKQLERLEFFIGKNRAFCHYIFSNSTHMDEKYFSRGTELPNSAVIDDRFSTPHEMLLSKILSNRMVREYLLSAIQEIENPISTSPLTWTSSKTDLVELIYALQAAGVFNKKHADLKQIATHLEKAFNVSLGNYYRVFQEIRQRKSSRAKFIESLKQAITQKMDEGEA
jgi:hypothetical protein